jgi:hypothetical protein
MHRTTNVAEWKFGFYVWVLYIRRGVVVVVVVVVVVGAVSGTAAPDGTVQCVAN